MPSNRYREIAPRIRDLMERHDLPYVTGCLGKQAASVYWKVVELSLPNKVEGRRRRDIVRLAREEGLAEEVARPLLSQRAAARP